jgi:hypothetical protein
MISNLDEYSPEKPVSRNAATPQRKALSPKKLCMVLFLIFSASLRLRYNRFVMS